jgi:lipopolysaccharide export LptBFGC system permease protein LptF
MKNDLQKAIWWSAILIFMSAPFCYFANPIGFAPDREMSYISFFIVAAVCFTVEVVIITQ